MMQSENNPGTMRGRVTGWAVLIVLSLVVIPLLAYTGIPTAPLLGAIIAAIALSVYGVHIQIYNLLFAIAQCLLGCSIARAITIDTLSGMMDHPVLILSAVFSAIVFSAVLGWVTTVKRIFPGTTGIWGISPGAAMSMILMSEGFGGDMRIVAFMQYTRVIMVATIASFVAGFMGLTPHAAIDPLRQFAFQPVPWQPFLQTMALVLGCLALCRHIRFPGANMMVAIFVGAVLENAAGLTIVLPNWLMLAAYVLVGWNIGLRFTRPVLEYAMHLLPRIFASILLLFVMCAAVGVLLHVGMDIDPLTAYLATCPGGADYMAIIVAATGGDAGFVLTIQTVRMVLTLFIMPPLARLSAMRVQKRMDKAA